MSDDFIVWMLSTDCNREGAEQVVPVLQEPDTRKYISRTVLGRSMTTMMKCRARCIPTCGLFH